MTVLAVHIYGDPCLREQSPPVAEIDDAVRTLARDMAETMYASRGIGLAAPQVGKNLRLFVMDTEWVDREGGEESHRRNPQVFINPEILWESPEDSCTSEGCLSLPDLEGDVYRPVRVRICWLDERGEAHEEEMDGIEARCVQHELDHLDGKLFIDRMSFMKRRLLAGKLRALKARGNAPIMIG